MLSNLKLGDTAWSVTLGDCKVKDLHNSCGHKRWEMRSLATGLTAFYRVCGRINDTDAMPSCYPERPEWVPPPVKMVNGIPVPDIALTDTNTSTVYVADPTAVNWVVESGGDYVSMAIKRGIAYPRTEEGREAARIHAMALLGLKPT